MNLFDSAKSAHAAGYSAGLQSKAAVPSAYRLQPLRQFFDAGRSAAHSGVAELASWRDARRALEPSQPITQSVWRQR